MSRAFTKEDDAGEDLPERPVPAGPNYMTPRGMELLKIQARELLEKKKRAQVEGGDTRPFDRDLRYLEARVDTAIIVPLGSGDEIRFGAHVTIERAQGKRTTFQIVGEDEARTGEQFLSWSSPLVEDMFGKKVGQVVKWLSEAGEETVRIVAVTYNS